MAVLAHCEPYRKELQTRAVQEWKSTGRTGPSWGQTNLPASRWVYTGCLWCCSQNAVPPTAQAPVPLTSLADNPSGKCPTSGGESQKGIKLCKKKVWITKATEKLGENGLLRASVYRDTRGSMFSEDSSCLRKCCCCSSLKRFTFWHC